MKKFCIGAVLTIMAIFPMRMTARDFVYKGIGYVVLDEQARTCSTKEHCRSYGSREVDNGHVEIPSEVYDENNVGFRVTKIGDSSFQCPYYVYYDEYYEEGYWNYEDGDLIDVKLPETLERIGEYAFSGLEIESIDLPGNVRYIGEHAFSSCKSLKSINLPYGIKRLEAGLFYKCTSLETVEIPNSVTDIEPAYYVYEDEYWGYGEPWGGEWNSIRLSCGVFESCTSLQNIRIPENVDYIGSCAFANCKNLESVTLPKELQFIGIASFYKCESLKEIICPISDLWNAQTYYFEAHESGILKDYGSEPFSENTYNTATLKVRIGELENARFCSPWKNFKNVVEMDFSDIQYVNCKDRIKVEIFSVNGTKIGENLEDLPSGIYIVRKGGKTTKVVMP